MNILLINNDNEAVERQKTAMAEMGGNNEIATCSPGLAVLEITKSFTPDMVILDAGRQSYDCMNTVQHMRKINPRVEIVLITCRDQQELRQEAQLASVGNIFEGPPSGSELAAIVKNIADSKLQLERRLITEHIDAVPRRRSRRKKPGKKPHVAALNAFGNIFFGALLLIVLALAFFLVQGKYTGGVPMVFGYRLYLVLSGSMNPTFDTGTLLFVRPAEPGTIEKGDIITFSSSGGGTSTTHRVVKVDESQGLEYTTRGDANTVDDPNPVPEENVIGRVHGYVPYLGYLIGFARTTLGVTCLLFVPGVLVIAYELRNIFKMSVEGKKRI